MAGRQHIFLIPGFFGFADIGGITYFHHVADFLREVLADVGIDARVTAVPTLPTASIRRRSAMLLQTIERVAGEDDHPIHLVGHSTGGLDARLLLTPHVALGPDLDPEPIVERVCSAVSIASPHRGTPLASFFGSLLGKKALWALSLSTVYTLRFGRVPLSLLFPLIGVLARMDDQLGFRNNILDQVYDNLLADFDADREKEVADFMEEIRKDQGLLRQLTPEGIDLFNASTSDRGTVRYGSVITMARKPGLRSGLEQGLNPYSHATHGLYRALWWMSSRNAGAPPLDEAHRAALRLGYGEAPDARANDGMVPTLSQPWGQVIHTTVGDHLDVCGHFNDPDHAPPHVDWVSTGSGFSREDFEALWQDVAVFIAASDDHGAASAH